MIKPINNIPENFLLFCDCDNKEEADNVKFSIKCSTDPNNNLYNIDILSFIKFLSTQYHCTPGIFGEKIIAAGDRICGVRYVDEIMSSEDSIIPFYDDSWVMWCARHTILVFSNNGDLIVDTAEKFKEFTEKTGKTIDNRAKYNMYAEIITKEINEYYKFSKESEITLIDDIIL